MKYLFELHFVFFYIYKNINFIYNYSQFIKYIYIYMTRVLYNFKIVLCKSLYANWTFIEKYFHILLGVASL